MNKTVRNIIFISAVIVVAYNQVQSYVHERFLKSQYVGMKMSDGKGPLPGGLSTMAPKPPEKKDEKVSEPALAEAKKNSIEGPAAPVSIPIARLAPVERSIVPPAPLSPPPAVEVPPPAVVSEVAPEQPPQLEKFYTIRKGDRLGQLSKKFFGSSDKWPLLWSYNPEITNPYVLQPGQIIRLIPLSSEELAALESRPSVSGSQQRETASVKTYSTYVASQDESLLDVLNKLYGTDQCYPKVWASNRHIANPHSLKTGTKIKIENGLCDK